MSEVKILERYIYPVKSLPGIKVARLELDSRGAVFDRQWMLVDNEHSFLTLRQMPELTLFRVTLGNFVELTWKDGDSMDFGLSETEGEAITVKIWKDQVKAFEVSSEVSEWLTSKLGKKVKLVRIADDAKRNFSEDEPEKSLRFVDSQPVLVISKASLELLDLKLGKRSSINRFRPNLVVDGLEAHEEDQIEGFNVGNIHFEFVKQCSRCRIIQIHPLTGELSEEPMKTLSTYRKEDGKVHFGAYFANSGPGVI